MFQDHQEAIESLERDLKARIVSPGADTFEFLEEALTRLDKIPLQRTQPQRISCLIDIASLFYLQGEKTILGLEPATVAVALARDCGDQTLLRRSLTIQAVILLSTNYPGDAITVLREALDISEAIGDEKGRVSSWVNIGTAFYEAGVYSDARECAKHAVYLAADLPIFRNWKASALGNVAAYSLHMQDYETGIENIHAALELAATPESANDVLARVFLEGTHTRLLLSLGRVSEASNRAQIARQLASQANSVRADIAAACSEGLVEVYAGLTTQGLARGLAALEKAREIRPLLRETLLAQIQAHEKAGLHGRALELHRELTMHLHRIQYECLFSEEDTQVEPIKSCAISGPHLEVSRQRVATALCKVARVKPQDVS